MEQPLSRVPLLGITGPFIGGILLASLPVSAWIPATTVIVVAAVLFLLRRNYLVIASLACLLGIMTAYIHRPASPPPSLEGETVTYSATIEAVAERESGLAITCRIDSAAHRPLPRPFKAMVWFLSSEREIAPGQRAVFTLSISPICEGTAIPDCFDYGAYLKRQGYTASAVLPPDALISVSGEPSRLWLWRNKLIHRLAMQPLDDPTIAFLSAMITGDSSLISENVRAALSRAGIAHILALSGLHVGIIALIVSIMLFPLSVAGFSRVRMGATIVALWLFAIFTGVSPSVVRAVVMATFVLCGRLLQRETFAVNSLLAAALLLLVIDPSLIYAIGFQLSFLAVGAILLLAEPLNPFNPRSMLLHAIGSYVCATVAAMLSAGLLSLFYFHTFPLWALLGNIIASVLLPPLLGVGMVISAWSLIGMVPAWICDIADRLYHLIESLGSLVASLPGASAEGIYISVPTLATALLAVAMIAVWAHVRRPFWIAGALILGLTSAAIHIATKPTYRPFEYYTVKAQNETVVIVNDDGRLWLVTAAPTAVHADLLAETSGRLEDYRMRRGLKPLTVAPDTLATRHTRRLGSRLATPHGSIMLVGHVLPSDSTAPQVDVAIITRHYKGSIAKLISRISTDSVAIGADVSRLRARRFEAECGEAGIRFGKVSERL